MTSGSVRKRSREQITLTGAVLGYLILGNNMIASDLEKFHEQQRRDASRLAAAAVRDALIRFPSCREQFYRLQVFAGLRVPNGPTDYQTALDAELRKVCE
jgi:ribosomal protein L13